MIFDSDDKDRKDLPILHDEGLMRRAMEARAEDLGIPVESLLELSHGYDTHGVYTGVSLSDILGTASLAHYGTPRHSGRYPWGSGDNPYQRSANFIWKVDEMRKAKGPDGKHLYKDVDIARSMGMTTTEYRKRIANARVEMRAYESQEAKRLKEKGMSTSAIARRMGKNESSVRLLLDEAVNERMSSTAKNATILKERLKEGGFIDIGKGSEHDLGISSTTLGNAVHLLEQEGYTIYKVQAHQPNDPKKATTITTLCPPGTEWKDVAQNMDQIKRINNVIADDSGRELKELRSYVSVDPARVGVRYAEDGGKDKDGVIELRRGVDDISLGKNNYAQVRILIGEDHYAKGMAVYADDKDLPPGVDILVNSNKHRGTPLMDSDPDAKQVLKTAKEEMENPFGANIKPDNKLVKAQRTYIDENGEERQSAINIVKEEGDVGDWERKLPAQFLSKQTPALAKQQLKMKYDIAKADFDEIASYENPTVKAAMLEDFAGKCERDAVHLSAAALPRQANKFILPLTNAKPNECYAPGFEDGEELALVRFPHASITEIPIVTVNNRNRKAIDIYGDAIDAIGIHPSTAERLSGADFDGDTVLAIPTKNVTIRNKPQYESLKDFDTKEAYPGYEGMKPMTHQQHGREMGVVSNLITDMTIMGAPDAELAMALKHSMVVVDAEKHKLNWKQSEIDNHIPELKERYQGGGGVATFLSRSKNPEMINERKEKAFSKMTPEEKERYLNGEQIWTYTGKDGTKKTRTFHDPMLSNMTKEERALWKNGDKNDQYQIRKRMEEEGRLRERVQEVMTQEKRGYLHHPYELLSTGDYETAKPIERVYADHAIRMKELAREARKLARAQVDNPRDPKAAERYSREVESLDKKLRKAEENSPKERQALILCNTNMKLVLQANPELKDDKPRLKKERSRQMELAREAVGAKKHSIGTKGNELTDREWEAIQAGAVTKTKLRAIIKNTDKSRLRELALPRTKTQLAPAKVARAKAMLKNGYSRADVCDMLDISESKLIDALDL